MSQRRQYASAALLQDGRVLISGGSKFVPIPGGEQLVWHDTADIYDPAVERFFPVLSRMSSIRDSHQSIVLSDGRVVLIGGQWGGGVNIDEVEVFDPSTNTFSVTATFPRLPVGGLAFDIGNGRILVYGGSNTDGPSIIDTNTWTRRMLSTEALHLRSACAGARLSNGKVLISGGAPWFGDNTEVYFDDIILFDPATETFESVGKMSLPRVGHSMLLLPDGKIAIYGGHYFDTVSRLGTVEPVVDVFDPATKSTQRVANLPAGMMWQYSLLLQNGYTLHIGGWATEFSVSAAEMIYDHSTNKSGYTASLVQARSNFAAVPLNNGLILVAGGTGNGMEVPGVALIHDTAEIFDPQSAVYVFMPSGSIPVGSLVPMQLEVHAAGPVTWTAQLGTIDQNGLYLPPLSVGDQTNPIDVVNATLTSDPSKKATVYITLITDTGLSPATAAEPKSK